MRLALSLLSLATLLAAQEAQQGSITGFVLDASQAVVPKAQIAITNQATGITRTVETSESGVYNAIALQPGVYNIKAAAAGFKTIEQTGIILNVGSSVRVDFRMEVGAVTETVVVRDVSPVLKTETGEVATLVSGTQVTEVPINGRNFTQFLALGTGVVSQQTGRQMGLGQEGNPLMGVHGGRISMNKYTYDGTLAMDTGGNRGLDLFPPMEAIGEVKVQKSNYGADVGGFGYGIVNIVTKSGGQQFHGDVYEYFRNDKLDSRNFFSNQRQSIRLNNFGYTLGGPFFIPGKYNTSKDRDFFFWSQSWARRVGPQIDSFTTPPAGVYTALVPTDAQRRGNFSGGAVIRDPSGSPYPGNVIPSSQLDPNALILTSAFYPLPNRAGVPNFVYNTRAFTTYREELMRWDHNFSSRWLWTTRYAQDTWFQDQDIKKPGPSVLPTFANRFGKPGKNMTTKLTAVVTPAVVNLFTFGYSFNQITNAPKGGFRPSELRIPEAFSSNPYKLIPDVTFAQGFAGLGISSILLNDNPIYTWKDDFSWNRGRHTIKIGTELMLHMKGQIDNGNEQGAFNFNGGVTGNAFADFLIGRAFTYTENGADPGTGVRQWDNEFYVQDDIKVTNRLTLNAGLRYYIISGSNGGASFNNKISAFVPSLYDPAKAPRLLADGQIVPGAGDPNNGLITGDDRRGLPLGPQLMVTNKDVFGPRLGFAYNVAGKTVLRGGYGTNYFWGTANNVGRHTNPPFVGSANIANTTLSNPTGGTGRLFPPNVNSLDVLNRQPSVHSWSFTIQRELLANTSLEIGYSGTRGSHLPRGIQLNQARPDLPGNANLRRPYLGYGTISYNENSAVSKYHGLEVSFIRRFSRGLMFEASYTWSKALGHPEGNPLDSRNKNLDFGLIDLDRTHMFSLNYVYELPVFKNAKGPMGRILGGWQISGITSFQSGLPFNVTQAGDVANFGGGTGGQRPDLAGNPHEGRGQSLQRYFNTAAYQQVTRPLGIGTAPVNSARGPGINNFDLAVLKNIAIREGVRFQLGMESFNILNHAQFEGVGSQLGATNFGVVTSARDPRVIQIRAKLSY
ncbi:MAG: TonB-dependent receptor [Acidobacteria bacterium]|nr:TonB-dependent receptor [Acidobacteriota bacterium]